MKAIQSVTPRPNGGNRRLICISNFLARHRFIHEIWFQFSSQAIRQISPFFLSFTSSFPSIGANNNKCSSHRFPFFPLQTSSSIYQTINRNYQSRSVSLLFFRSGDLWGPLFSTHFLKIKNDFQIVDISMIQSVYVEVLVQVKD